MRIRLINLLLVTCTIVLSSCSQLEELQLTGIKGFNVSKISANGLEGRLMVGIKNPNRIGFAVFPSDFTVKYSGIELGTARLNKKVKIKGGAEKIYTFEINSDFRNANLLDVMKLLRGASFRNEINVRGDLRVGTFLYKKKIPVDLSENLKLQ